MADLRVHGNKRVAHPISIVVTASTPTCATRLVSAAWSFVVEGWIMPPIMVIAFAAGPPSTERRRPQHANTPRRTTGSTRQPEGSATFSGARARRLAAVRPPGRQCAGCCGSRCGLQHTTVPVIRYCSGRRPLGTSCAPRWRHPRGHLLEPQARRRSKSTRRCRGPRRAGLSRYGGGSTTRRGPSSRRTSSPSAMWASSRARGRRSSRGCRRRSRNADCRRARGRTGRGP